jgi:hypothetical protein
MTRARRKTFPAIARLSRTAREIVERAFLEGPGVRSVKSICQEVREKTGEIVDDNAIYRYQNYWFTVERPFVEARREADGMLAALKQNPTADVEEIVKQRLTIAQLLAAKRFDQSDPIALGYLAQGEKRLELNRARLAIEKQKLDIERQKVVALERQVAIKERQMEEMREKAAAAENRVEEMARKKKLDPETLRVIKEEIYGIVEPTH